MPSARMISGRGIAFYWQIFTGMRRLGTQSASQIERAAGRRTRLPYRHTRQSVSQASCRKDAIEDIGLLQGRSDRKLAERFLKSCKDRRIVP